MVKIVALALFLFQAVPSLEWIRMKFDDFNLLWFDGKLPKPIILYSDQIGNKAITYYHAGRFYIKFSPMHNLSETTTIMHLLHEMCHVDTWWDVDVQMDRHEASWQKCMHGLADKGAFDAYW